jgi:energy-coupling factor transporter transmembrane protein EcfT
MTTREHDSARAPLAIAAVWGAVVTAALVAAPLALRDRLPEPLAVHWGPGFTADRAASFAVSVAMPVALWAALWLMLLVAAARGLSRRSARASWWAGLTGGGLFALGLSGLTLLANLDAASWTEAALPLWAPLALVAVPVAAGTLGGYLGRGAPDERRTDHEPPVLRLGPGQRAVWVSRISNPWPLAIAVVAAVALFALGAFEITGIATAPVVTGVLTALGAVLVVGLFASSLTARVTDDGLALGFGPLGWPKRRIRLAKIDKAWTEERNPSQVGGWGVRGLPGAATIMLRGGECLVIGYRSGGQLAISIDDAERGASLINALVAERTAE